MSKISNYKVIVGIFTAFIVGGIFGFLGKNIIPWNNGRCTWDGMMGLFAEVGNVDYKPLSVAKRVQKTVSSPKCATPKIEYRTEAVEEMAIASFLDPNSVYSLFLYRS